ncbi:DUF417 family protein [Sphingobacterium mizutaii]|uniref:DUF417 family protein n=1 Tax=Sphingobacterium mizutaii TaxID=1010 RepID=UPI0016279026|nr:DUF417 family protein [Sphingobacterium mizutaii]
MEKNKTGTVSEEKPVIGFYVSLFGAVLILLWIGALKFTLAEAQAIKPLLEHHPLSAWMYRMFSIQTVSNMVGFVEIIVALLVLISLKISALKRYAAIGLCVIFSVTLSFLFTTPNIWRRVEWVPVTDFFILKDIMLLGVGLTLFEKPKTNHHEN